MRLHATRELDLDEYEDDQLVEMMKRAERVCARCHEPFGLGKRCQECGVSETRRVRRRPSRSKPGGKRGRNSGKVSQHGKKG